MNPSRTLYKHKNSINLTSLPINKEYLYETQKRSEGLKNATNILSTLASYKVYFRNNSSEKMGHLELLRNFIGNKKIFFRFSTLLSDYNQVLSPKNSRRDKTSSTINSLNCFSENKTVLFRKFNLQEQIFLIETIYTFTRGHVDSHNLGDSKSCGTF